MEPAGNAEFKSYLSAQTQLKELSRRTYTSHYTKVRNGVGQDLIEAEEDDKEKEDLL